MPQSGARTKHAYLTVDGDLYAAAGDSFALALAAAGSFVDATSRNVYLYNADRGGVVRFPVSHGFWGYWANFVSDYRDGATVALFLGLARLDAMFHPSGASGEA